MTCPSRDDHQEGKDSSRATFKDLNDGMRESQLQDSAGNGGTYN